MGWEDRDYADDNERAGHGRPGGDWQGVRPSFDNPMSWSLPLGAFSGILVRVHVLFLLFVVIELVKAFAAPAQGSGGFSLGWAVALCVSFFVVVLLHEFGHCLACRLRGGQADEILMWPLGGLAFCRPREHWSDHFVTAVGGPMVNVVLLAVICPLLGIATGIWWGVAIPNPLDLYGGIVRTSGNPLYGILFVLNWVSLVLLLFNLLPLFPLDGGRMVQTLLWAKMGYARSMRVAVRVGYVGAIALGVFGVVTTNVILILIAVFGGMTCHTTLKQLQYTEALMGFEGESWQSYGDEDEDEAREARESWKERRQRRHAEREAVRAQEEEVEVDRILDKIQKSGMQSLTASEKRVLQRVTDRRRDE